ncbi:hypothetical protein BDZ45DRAFT_657175 [Acephala macrosclerotiorum]|nr:hypothetical protein BDZ45DRAFT_657175 [Acephala macrosclerotiorum]
MVVTQVQETEQPKVDLFVLLRPKRGLCTPHHIGQQNCFYLPKFRDGSTVLKERGPAWNALVAKQALRPSDRVLSKKQMAYKKARNTSKVVLEPAVSLQNSICTHVECFAESSDMWHLQEISSILEQADQDLLFMPIASNTAMRKFVDNEEEFEDGDSTTEGGDAALMLEEVRALWPDLKEIDAADLAFLKRQLMTQDVTLEYRLLRPFLFEACYRLRAFDNLSDVSTNVVADVLGSVQRIVGTCESAAPIITADDQALLLPAITMTLKNMLQAAQKFDKGLLDSCGDQTMTGTLQDVWEKYANALDTDAAKLSWMEAARYMVAAFKYKQRGLSDMLAEVVETLEKTGFGSSRSSESS